MSWREQVYPGAVFHRLTVKELTTKKRPNGRFRQMAVCECQCGGQTVTAVEKLMSEHTRSCGCYQIERAIAGSATHGASANGRQTRLYQIFAGMHRRCYNPHEKYYFRYGERGITVCKEWHRNFPAFRDWALANGYRDDLELDRINNDGIYEPGNCRWATTKQQVRNTCRNRRVTAFGETKCVAEWAEDSRCKASLKVLYQRLGRSWPPEKAIATPMRIWPSMA